MNAATILAKLEAAYDADTHDANGEYCADKAREFYKNFPNLDAAIEEILDD